MTTFQVIHGLELNGSNGQKAIERTPEGRAFGSIPKRCALYTFRDEFIDADTLATRNRAVPSAMPDPSYTSTDYQMGEFPNGAQGFDAGNDLASNSLTIPGTEDINPEAWTFFAVMYREGVDGQSSRQLLLSPENEETLDTVTPHIAMSDSWNYVTVYENSTLDSGQPTRLSYSVPVEDQTGPILVMVTFSVERGLALYVNGTLRVTEETDKRPLDTGYKGGEYRFFRRTDQVIGTGGIYNLDLSASENAGYRAAIVGYARDHFGVPA